jgi:hypothetical protein
MNLNFIPMSEGRSAAFTHLLVVLLIIISVG